VSGGYTPLFSTLTTGTLCGRWPDIGLWPIVLSLCDKNGHVDVTPMYLAGVTGLPVDEVIACMKRFCAPDPYSRSGDADGARLVLLDEHRDWGWLVVNHRKYREKARKSTFDAARIEDGRNKDRMKTRAHPRSPAQTHRDPPSDSDANSNTNLRKEIPSESLSSSKQLDPAVRVFDHWKSVWQHPRAALDPKRTATIKRALKAYDADTLCESISGYRFSPHHMGQNDRNTVFDDIGLFLRDASHIDAGLRFFRSPPELTSPTTQHNVTVLQNWKPPEARDEDSRYSEISGGDGEHSRRVYPPYLAADH
jgi:hypothetical protein